MNKKTIITNTAIFIFVMAFVLIFKAVFGSENTLIGVTTITATLMFLGRDFTGEPLKNTLKFVGINLLIGIGTSLIVVSNLWLGLVINFIIVFTFSYVFTYNLRQPLYVPFGLQYLFLLTTPVAPERLGVRLVALICGALIIMLTQILANKKKLETSGNKILIGVCESIENNINCIKGKSTNYSSIEAINTSIDEFRTIVYDKRESNYYLTEEAKIKLNMSVALENINALLNSKTNESVNLIIVDTLEEIVKVAEKAISVNHKKGETVKLGSYNMNELMVYCQDNEVDDLLNLQLLESMIFLDDTISDLSKLDKKNYKSTNKIGDKSEIFSKKAIKNILSGSNSPKYCYAMRLAITTTIGLFLMNYFNLSEGRWILFTVLSLTTPLYETSKHKIRYRIGSTLVGSVIILILFGIFKTETSRLLIVMLTGYLQGYVNEYKYKTIFVTVSAIGSAAIIGNVQELTAERIVMVVIGTVIAILANRYLFPYNLEKSNEQLKRAYDASIKKMFKEINNLNKGSKNPEVIKNLFVITSLIESKARMNQQIDLDENYNGIVNERRCLVGNVYELYMWIYKENIKKEDEEKIINDVKSLIEYNDDDISDKLLKIENGIKESKSIKTRITLSTIVVILNELKRLTELNGLKEKAQI